jgi:hypothetical protein
VDAQPAGHLQISRKARRAKAGLACSCLQLIDQIRGDFAGHLQTILKLEQANGVGGADTHAAIGLADVETQLVQQLLSLANGIWFAACGFNAARKA